MGAANKTAMDDKKFHCSVCNKAFRLEAAGKLHLKQAHGGDGEINQGPGPGYSPPEKSSRPIDSTVEHGADAFFRPSKKRSVMPRPLNKSVMDCPADAMQALLEQWDNIGEKRLGPKFIKSSRAKKVMAVELDAEAPTYETKSQIPTENPFELSSVTEAAKSATSSQAKGTKSDSAIQPNAPFKSCREVGFELADHWISPFSPCAALNPCLPPQKKVPRAQPEEPKESLSAQSSAPEVYPNEKEVKETKVKEHADGIDEKICIEESNAKDTLFKDSPFAAAVAPSAISDNFVAAPSPFGAQPKGSSADAAVMESPTSQGAAVASAIPTQLASTLVSSIGSASPTASPFAAASPTASPFAAASPAASPFAAASPAASPFAGAFTSPFSTTHPTPTSNGQEARPVIEATAFAASPFAMPPSAGAAPGVTVPSPFATPTQAVAASPFTASVGTGSPFTSTPNAVPSPFGTASTFCGAAVTSPFGLSEYPTQSAEAPPPEVPTYPCKVCGKVFTSEHGMITHNKDKHGINVEAKEPRRGQQLPKLVDLPPYVPAPVDMATAAPYGSERPLQAQAVWSEVELFPHALCVSNIDVIGVVEAIEESTFHGVTVTLLTVHVSAGADNESEDIVVRCFGNDLQSYITENVQQGSTVSVSGALRLNPTHNAALNRYYFVPAVHVAAPTGILFAFD